MRTRFEVAKDVGFQESENSEGLLSWFVKKDTVDRIFLDFRTEGDDGDYDGYEEDMPPRIYAMVEDDEGETEWINDSGDTKERFEEQVKSHWAVEKVEDESGLDDDRGQMGLDWFSDDGGIREQKCEDCGDMFPVTDLEEGLCIGEETNGCFYDEYPSQLIREAKKRKEKLREQRRE